MWSSDPEVKSRALNRTWTGAKPWVSSKAWMDRWWKWETRTGIYYKNWPGTPMAYLPICQGVQPGFECRGILSRLCCPQCVRVWGWRVYLPWLPSFKWLCITPFFPLPGMSDRPTVCHVRSDTYCKRHNCLYCVKFMKYCIGNWVLLASDREEKKGSRRGLMRERENDYSPFPNLLLEWVWHIYLMRFFLFLFKKLTIYVLN